MTVSALKEQQAKKTENTAAEALKGADAKNTDGGWKDGTYEGEGQGFGGKLQVDFTENEDDYITLGRFNPAGDTMCIKKGKVIRSEYADTYCSPFYYIQMDDAREFMHNLAGFGHHQVLIFGDYTKMIKKIAKVMNFNILEG